MAYAFISPQAAAGTGLQKAVRDPVRESDNDGVRMIFDLAFPFSYPGGPKPRAAAGAPANGASVYDVAERGDGSIVLAAGQTLNYAGGGFDFSSLTTGPDYIQGSGAFSTDIASAIAGAPAAYAGLVQRFLACMYVKLPVDADWNSNASNLFALLQWAAVQYSSGPEVLLIGQAANNSKTLTFRRQTNGSAYDGSSIVVAAADRGTMAQIAFWRSATEQRARIRTANGITLSASLAVGADNVGSISGLQSKWGIGPAFLASPLSAHGGAKNFRLYRGFLENLARSGRDPTAVLDADWLRVQTRMAISAAANGGVSQIFN